MLPAAPITLDSLVGALRRRWVPAALAALAVLSGTVAVTLLSPRGYQSEGLIFVRLGRENATLDPTATLGQATVVAVPLSRETELNSLLEMMRSVTVLQAVLDRVGVVPILGREGTPLEALERLQKGLTVEIVKKSSVIRVAWEGPTPEACQEVVQALLDLYPEQHVQVHRNPGAYRFLTTQAGDLRKSLAQAEEALRQAKDETGLAAPEAERQILVTRIGRLEDEAQQAATALAAADREEAALEGRLAGLPERQVVGTTRGGGNSAADALRGQLVSLQLKEKELSARFSDRHPELRQVREQLAAARQAQNAGEGDREQVTTGPGRLREEVALAVVRQQGQRAGLEARLKSLEAKLTGERQRLTNFNKHAQRVGALQRDAELADAAYRKAAANLEQVTADHALETQKISNLGIVQRATLDPRPIKPRKTVYFAFGAVAAVFAGLTTALALERFGRQPPDGDQASLSSSSPTSPPTSPPPRAGRRTPTPGLTNSPDDDRDEEVSLA